MFNNYSCSKDYEETRFLSDSNIQDQKCFAADSLVTLANGKHKIIADLQSDDILLAYNDLTKQVVTTPLITMMDYQPHHFGITSLFTMITLSLFLLLALFKQITTVTGQQLSLTSSHLLPTPSNDYIMAKHIQNGMNIYIMNDEGTLVSDTVSNVTDIIKQGYMAPLTEEGTLIVNNIAASCYATINSHHVAHTVLAPMRWWYRLFGMKGDGEEKMEGVHWFPQMVYDMTASVLPSIIQK